MPGPLAGYRVVDLSTMISGPMATMLLGDQGADVIKVEAPGAGDLVRRLGRSRDGISATFCCWVISAWIFSSVMWPVGQTDAHAPQAMHTSVWM